MRPLYQPLQLLTPFTDYRTHPRYRFPLAQPHGTIDATNLDRMTLEDLRDAEKALAEANVPRTRHGYYELRASGEMIQSLMRQCRAEHVTIMTVSEAKCLSAHKLFDGEHIRGVIGAILLIEVPPP